MATEVEDPASACALDVLAAVASRSCLGGATVAQIVEITGRNRSVVNRLLLDLAGLGLVARDPRTRRARLDWAWYVLAVRVGQHRVVRHGQRLLDQLSAEAGETAYLVVREGRNAVTRAESIPLHRSIQVASWVGRSWPIARSDAGPSLLIDVAPADLPLALGRGVLTRGGAAVNAPRTVAGFATLVDEVRRRGHSALDEQTEAGVASVAAPVRDCTGRVVAALVVSGPSQRMRPRLELLGDRVERAAAALGAALGAADRREPRSATVTSGRELPDPRRNPAQRAPSEPAGSISTNAGRRLQLLRAVLEAEAAGQAGAGVVAVADAAGRERSQVSRGLALLDAAGLVTRDDHTLEYAPSAALLRLCSGGGRPDLVRAARPVLSDLAARMGERSTLEVPVRGATMVVETVSSGEPVEAVAWVGRTSPAWCTAAGRASLFDHDLDAVRSMLHGADFDAGPLAPQSADEVIERLHDDRRRGVAVAVGELEDGLVSLAAPVRERAGIVGMVVVSAPSYRLGDGIERAVSLVGAAAERVATRLHADARPETGGAT